MNNRWYLYHKCFALHCTLMILHLLLMHRTVRRIVCNARMEARQRTYEVDECVNLGD